jgi:hypothetical protein
MTMESTTTLELPGAPAVASSDLLAWEVEIHSMRCICFASTKAKAQWLATKSYWEAYGKNSWPRARAWRAEHHDKSVLRFHEHQRAWGEDHVLSASTR